MFNKTKNNNKGSNIDELDPTQDYLYNLMKYRRTTRKFLPDPIDDEKLKRILQAGIYAPSGANKSPFRIYVIRDKSIKERIKTEAEKVEEEFYRKEKRKSDKEFLNWVGSKEISVAKPFLINAPVILSVVEDSTYNQNHSKESTWLTVAYLILAIEAEGLATVTYTPEPQEFMKLILNLPEKYSPQVILPIGYPKVEKSKEPFRPVISKRVYFL